jgi:hypothetical protein
MEVLRVRRGYSLGVPLLPMQVLIEALLFYPERTIIVSRMFGTLTGFWHGLKSQVHKFFAKLSQ